ncbi:DUF4386 domain-containing protein, partial [bacterium]
MRQEWGRQRARFVLRFRRGQSRHAADQGIKQESKVTQTQSTKLTGIFFIVIPILINIPYGLLIANFQYPDILRQSAGEILIKFHEGGPGLILTWWAFALAGVPLIYSTIGLHSLLDREDTPYLTVGTACGVLALVAQLVGLLRWVFVVPVLASSYV